MLCRFELSVYKAAFIKALHLCHLRGHITTVSSQVCPDKLMIGLVQMMPGKSFGNECNIVQLQIAEPMLQHSFLACIYSCSDARFLEGKFPLFSRTYGVLSNTMWHLTLCAQTLCSGHMLIQATQDYRLECAIDSPPKTLLCGLLSREASSLKLPTCDSYW